MEKIAEGFDVFVHDGDKAVAAVRRVMAGEIVIYVENAGDFVVPRSAIKDIHDDKIVLDGGKLDAALSRAIGRAHRREDPTI